MKEGMAMQGIALLLGPLLGLCQAQCHQRCRHVLHRLLDWGDGQPQLLLHPQIVDLLHRLSRLAGSKLTVGEALLQGRPRQVIWSAVLQAAYICQNEQWIASRQRSCPTQHHTKQQRDDATRPGWV